jgi:hypothetical protein
MDMKVIEGLLQEVDKNGDGQIDFHEVLGHMSLVQQSQKVLINIVSASGVWYGALTAPLPPLSSFLP